MAKITKRDFERQQEHPVDKAQRIESERLAAERIEAFFAANTKRFRDLVQLYADSDAAQLLADLRESFWSDL